MHRSLHITRSACVSALIMLAAAPAFAGDHDRAVKAITTAQAKIDAANKVGASGEVPGMVARAQAELSTAREALQRGHKLMAFDQATDASRLADTALGTAQRNQLDAVRDQRDTAQAAALQAQAEAANANDRAASAEQAAAVAAARADAMRYTPPAPPTTTVTVEKTERIASHRTPVRKRMIRRTTTGGSIQTTEENASTTVTTVPSQGY
jgi:hypothetical protein